MRDKYASMIRALFPRGIIWSIEPGSNLDKLIHALAGETERIEIFLFEVLAEFDPRTTTKLIPEWKEMVGRPCNQPWPKDLNQTRNIIAARYTAKGGQDEAYFQALANQFGFTISISRYLPFRSGRGRAGHPLASDRMRHVAVITADTTVSVIRFRAGYSRAGNSLIQAINSGFECAVSRSTHSHARILIYYTNINDA